MIIARSDPKKLLNTYVMQHILIKDNFQGTEAAFIKRLFA